MSVLVIRGDSWEDASPFLMARIQDEDGVNIKVASISSISYTVYNETDSSVISAATSLTMSDVVFDALKTDSRWTKDSTGYNFGFDLPASKLPDGFKKVIVDVAITPISGGEIPVIFVIHTHKRYKS